MCPAHPRTHSIFRTCTGQSQVRARGTMNDSVKDTHPSLHQQLQRFDSLKEEWVEQVRAEKGQGAHSRSSYPPDTTHVALLYARAYTH